MPVPEARAADVRAAELLERLPASLGAAAVHRDSTTVVAVDPVEVVAADGAAALAALDSFTPGFWVGFLSFELGHAVEHVDALGASREEPHVPDLVFARFAARALVDPHGTVEIEGDGRAREDLERAASPTRARHPGRPVPVEFDTATSSWRGSLSHDAFASRVQDVLDLLRAGECYQVNLTRRLSCDWAPPAVALYRQLASRHPAPHLGVLRLPDGIGGDRSARPLAVVSASPERFLSRRGSRIETRPIKGTARTAAELGSSAKDHAENVMIVDLARNDLGRVCEPGSIHVPGLFEIEAHPGLYHLVSTVRGRLRLDATLGDLVRATFPPASVTGAPKPRVLQAIEVLEPVRRGVYCGAFGWVDTVRHEADLAVAIRTFTMLGAEPGDPSGGGGVTHFGVGSGIVVDSDPEAEWRETELKAARLLAVAAGVRAGSSFVGA